MAKTRSVTFSRMSDATPEDFDIIQANNEYGGSQARYRRDGAFRWEYLDYLAP